MYIVPVYVFVCLCIRVFVCLCVCVFVCLCVFVFVWLLVGWLVGWSVGGSLLVLGGRWVGFGLQNRFEWLDTTPSNLGKRCLGACGGMLWLGWWAGVSEVGSRVFLGGQAP